MLVCVVGQGGPGGPGGTYYVHLACSLLGGSKCQLDHKNIWPGIEIAILLEWDRGDIGFHVVVRWAKMKGPMGSSVLHIYRRHALRCVEVDLVDIWSDCDRVVCLLWPNVL